MLLLFCIKSVGLLHAQTQLEATVASYTAPPNGPTVSSQTTTLLENTTGAVFATFSPAITYTLSFANQQYNAVTGIATGTGMSFGTSLNSSAKTATAISVVNPLALVGTGVDANHTSNPNGVAGTGIDVNVNYGSRIFLAAEAMYSAGSSLSGRYYFGDLIMTFNRPVSDPVMQVVGLGGTFVSGSTEGFTMEYELQTTGVTLSKISGSAFFNVTANKILNSNTGAITALCAGGGACGSAKVAGTNITSLTFKLYLRGDGKGSAWSNATTFSGEASTLSVSMNKPVTVSGTVLADVNGATDGLVNGTGTNAGGVLFANLVDASNKIVATALVAAGGSYSFPAIGAGSYSVSLSTVSGAQGSTSPSAALPSDYVNTGEGILAAGDGTPDGTTAITVASADITGIDFGINRYPSANNGTVGGQVNPKSTVQVAISSANFSGTDPDAGGQISSFKFTAFPSNVTSITISGINYTAATFPIGGVTVAASAGALPAGAVSIDPVDGFVTAVIPYKTIDPGGLQSLVAATVSIQFSSVLPLQLVSFTGVNTGGRVSIKWTTSNEINTGRFEVQKSADASQWKVLASVDAAGNVAGTMDYNLIDNMPYENINYYRIKIIDMDNSYIYSKTLKITNENATIPDQVKITPNPIKDGAVIEITAIREEFKTITIVNASGKKIQSYNHKTIKGVNKFTIDNTVKWQNGLYYVVVQDNAGNVTGVYKLVKE